MSKRAATPPARLSIFAELADTTAKPGMCGFAGDDPPRHR